MLALEWSLLSALVLGIVHISADSFSYKAQVGNAYTVGSRDQHKEREGLAGRLHRATRNYIDNLVLFMGVVVLAWHKGTGSELVEWGALVWVAGRVAYLPAYASGIPWVRTICWQFSMVGLVLMMVALHL